MWGACHFEPVHLLSLRPSPVLHNREQEVQRFWNRAGDKLSDVHDACDIFDGIEPGFAFLDLCAGPGAFSQVCPMRGWWP